MIKFRATKDDKPLFGFGLSEWNLERLREGKPILVNLEVLGGEGHVLIFYGRTEGEMETEIKKYILTPEV